MLRLFGVLARLKGLRGTVFDVFGYSAERRTERQLIVAYERTIERVLAALTPANHGAAVELAGLPERIRGFGHVKQRHLDDAQRHEAALWQAFERAGTGAVAAE
jgi:indolepyruvate ferredoxin oxidoreductase